jgi:hypothetical protein
MMTLPTTRYLLAAAIKGHQKLAELLQYMDCISEVCQKCGKIVYSQELQEAIC